MIHDIQLIKDIVVDYALIKKGTIITAKHVHHSVLNACVLISDYVPHDDFLIYGDDFREVKNEHN